MNTELSIVPIGDGFRLLKKGEIIEHGDEYLDPFSLRWHPTKSVGIAAGTKFKTTSVYRRPIKTPPTL